MATVNVDIVSNFNTDSLEKATQYIRQQRLELSQMQQDIASSMDGMSSPATMLVDQLMRAVQTADQFAEKAKEASGYLTGEGSRSEEEDTSMSYQLQNILDDFNAMKQVLTGSGSFSVDLAKSMFQSLPSEIQKQFNAITPQIVANLRTGMSALYKGKNKIDSSDIPGIVSDAMWMPQIEKLLSTTSASQAQKEAFVKALIPNAMPVQRSAEYQIARFGTTLGQTKRPQTVEEVLPEVFKGWYDNGGHLSRNVESPSEILGINGTTKLLRNISSNSIAARAAVQSGLMARDSAGILTLNDNVSREKLLDYRDALLNEFYTRTNGLYRHITDTGDYFTDKDETQQKIIQRAQSGTGGETLAAMRSFNDIWSKEDFGPATEGVAVKRQIKPEDEAKRKKEMYTVGKVSPFLPAGTKTSDGNDDTVNQRVAIAESQMTRLLGLQGKNYSYTPAVKMVSMAGYDENNPEHVAILRDYLQNGYTSDEGHYTVHTAHGTGGNTVLRMIRDEERKSITDRYRPFARQLGLQGDDVLNAFVPKWQLNEDGSIEQNGDGQYIPYEFKSPQALGKHIEQLNKMWTDSYETGADLSQKDFALIDFSRLQEKYGKQSKIEFSNGLGFLGTGMGPAAFQARFGISGKGSFYNTGTETLGEWAERAGLLDDQGRFMVPGIDGTEFDASKYHGAMDLSMIKNLLAYQGLNNEEANRALTGLVREFPLQVAADYGYDDKANSLGSQMSTFLAYSPDIMLHQAKNLGSRLLELETLQGQRKYVFNNPEADEVAQLANDPINGDRFMLTDPRVRERVETYKKSLMQDVGAGEFINYNSIADIQNERLLRSPVAAYFMTKGGMTEEQIADYQQRFKNAHRANFQKEYLDQIDRSSLSEDEILRAEENARRQAEEALNAQFTAENVRKYMMLEGGVADFGHIDSDEVAALRSPTGFDQVIVRKNYAKYLKPIYEQMGESVTGFHGNEEDYLTLAGADMDADMVKSVADKDNLEGTKIENGKTVATKLSLVDDIKKLKERTAALGIKDFESEIKTQDMPTLEGGNNMENVDNWIRMVQLSLMAPLEMGKYSDAGSRLAGNLDLLDNSMRFAAATAMKANKGYDPATTLNKKPLQIMQDYAIGQALSLGQEYSKIPAHLEDAYNVMKQEDDKGNIFYTTKDGKTVIDAQNVFKTSSGHLINKTYFDRLDKTNLPSVHSTSAMLAMLGNKMAFANGLVDTQLLDDLMEVFGVTEPSNGKTEGEAIGYNGAGEATKRLMKNMRAIRAQHYGFQRYKETDDELDILASQYAEAKQEIRNQFFERLKTENLGDQRIMEDGQAMDQDTYERYMAKKYGLEQVENMLGRTKIGPNGRKVTVSTGASDTSIRARYGEGISTMLNNQENVALADSTRGIVVDPRLADYYIYGEQSHRHAIGRVAEDKIDTKQTKKRKPSIKTLEKNLASLRSEINNETGLTSTLFDMEDEDYASMLEDMRNPTSQYQNATTEQRRKLNGLIDKWQSTYQEIKQRKAPKNKTRVSSLSQNENGSVPPSPPSPPFPPDGPNGPFDPNGLLGWSSYEQFFSDLGMGNEKAVQAVLQGQGAMMAWENIRERSTKFKSSMMKEAKKQTDITDSDNWYASTLGILNSLGESVKAVKGVGGKNVDPTNNSTASNDEKAYNDAVASFSVGRSAHVQSTIDSTLNFLDRSINGKGTKSDQQEEILKKWEDQKTNLESEKNNYLLSLTAQTDIDKQGNDKSTSEVAKLDKAIKEAQEKINAGRKKLFEGNAQSIEDAASSFDQIIEGKDQSPQSKINRTLKKAKDSLADMRNDLEDYFSHNLIDPEEYKRLDQELKNRETKLNDGTYKKQLATYLNYDEKIQQAKSRIGLRQTAAELAGHVLTPDQEIAQATEKMIINRNSLINSLRRSGNNTDADRVERQFTDDELQRVARNDYNRTLRLRREQEQNRQTQLQSSYLMDDQRLNMTDKLVGNQRQALRFNELNRINSAITARNQERASYEKELNTLRDRDRLSRSGSAVMSNTDRNRLTELEQRDVALRLQIAGYQSQRSNLDNRLQYQDRNIENADRLRREQQLNRNVQSNRQYEADERRLSGESTTVQGRNADIRDQELNRIQNQRHSNNQQIEQNRQRIQALRNQRRSGTLSRDEISELTELEVANRQLRSNNIGLNHREQNIDSYLQLQYNANARQDQTRQAQQAARAAQMAMQHQQTTDTFNFDQNRVENIARRANDQMMNQLRQANVQDLDLINTNRTRLEQLARKGRNGGISLVNGQMVLGNEANRTEWDRLQREITEAERRRSDREAQMQNEEYLRRNREMAQRQDDLQATQMHDQYLQTQRRHEQVRRNRYGGQYGIAGRLLSLRDNKIQEATSIRQGYERDIVNTQNALMKYTDGNGNLKDNLSDEERQKAQQLQQDLAGYQQSLAQVRKEEEQMSGIGGTVAASFDMIGQSVQRLTQRLGRQLFQKALQEAKKFIQEYDKSMTEIQMITLKSNDEINVLGKNLIQTALDNRSNVSETTSAAASLYRQGLSDEEVDTRLEDVLKFSKVAGIKTEEASKIITTALQNDLVENSDEAMDALVALGDTAATTASEIAKGMQKSAASAKQAGMSYGELVTLLTIGTSKTQLGGASIGSALQTMIYRLYKVNKNEDFYDENGNHVAATDATKALERMGISLFDESGNFRGPYQILQDVASGWENADDVTQSAILSTLGAGRQRSNVATFLQGLAQDNGEIAGRYLNTAETSQGITDRKYLEYLDSLEAAQNNVKTSFDQLIETFNLGGQGSGFLNYIAELIQGLTQAEQSTGALSTAIKTLGVGFVGLIAASHPFIAIAAAVVAAVGEIGNSQKKTDISTQEKFLQTRYQNIAEGTQETDRVIEETKALIKKKNSKEGLTSDESVKLQGNLDALSSRFVGITGSVNGLTGSYDALIAKMKEYQQENDKIKQGNTRNVIQGAMTAAQTSFVSNYNAINATRLSSDSLADFDSGTALPLSYYFTHPADFAKVMNRNAGFGEDIAATAFNALNDIPLIGSWLNAGPLSWMSGGKNGSTVDGLLSDYGTLKNNSNAIESLIQQMYKTGILQSEAPWYNTVRTSKSPESALNELIYGTGTNFQQNDRDRFYVDLGNSYQAALENNLNISDDVYEEDINRQLQASVKTFAENWIRTAVSSVSDNTDLADHIIGTFVENVTGSEGFYTNAENAGAALYRELATFAQYLYNPDGSINLDGLTNYSLLGSSEIPSKLYSFNGANNLEYNEAYAQQAQYRADRAAEIRHNPQILRALGYNDLSDEDLLTKTGNIPDIVGPSLNKNSLEKMISTFAENVARDELTLRKNPAQSVNELEAIESNAYDLVYNDLINRFNNQYPDNTDDNPRLLNYRILSFAKNVLGYNDERIDQFRGNDWSFQGETFNSQEEALKAREQYQKNLVAGLRENLDVYSELMADSIGDITDDELIKKAVEAGLVDPIPEVSENVSDAVEEISTSIVSAAIDKAKADARNSNDSTRAKYQADQTYQEIDDLGITDLQGLIDAAEEGKITNFSTMLSTLGLGDLLDQYTIEQNGKVISTDYGNAAFSQIMAAIAKGSNLYSGYSSDIFSTRFQQAQNALNFISGYRDEGWQDVDFNEMQTVLGQSLASRLMARRENRNEEVTDLELLYASQLAQNYQYGINGLTEGQRLAGAQQLYNLAQVGQYGTVSGLDQGMLSAYLGGVSGLDTYAAASMALKDARIEGGMQGLSELKEGTQAYENAEKALEPYYATLKAAIQATKDLDAEIASKGTKAMNQFGEYTDDVATSVTNLAKGGRTASSELGKMRKQMSQLSNAALAVQQSAGKTGKQLSANQRNDLAAVTGEDADLIKEMSKEQIEKLRQRAQEIIDDEFVQDIGGTIQERLNQLMADNKITTDMLVDMGIDVNGELDLGDISKIAAELKDEALAELASHAGTIGQLVIELEKKGLGETAVAKLIKGNVTGTGKRTGGGGGGGGKSATDKLLEKQKFRTSEIQHRSNLAQAQGEAAARANDYTGQITSINQQISIQGDLRAEYERNIAEMQKQLSSVKQGEDDWKKLSQAIWEAEEALAKITTTISDLNKQRLSITLAQIENEDMPVQYNRDVVSRQMDYAQLTERFDQYRELGRQRIAVNSYDAQQNNAQLARLRADYDHFVATEPGGAESQNAIDTLKEINKITLENMDLEKESMQLFKELQQAELNRLQLELTRETAVSQATSGIASQKASIAAGAESYYQQRQYIQEQKKSNENIIETRERLRKNFKANLDAQVPDTEEWLNAFNAYADNESQIWSLVANNQQLDQEYESSFLQEIVKGYEDATIWAQHYAQAAQSVAQIYKNDGDFDNYRASMQEAKQNYIDLAAAASSEVTVLRLKLSAMKETDVGYEETVKALQDAENKEFEYAQAVQNTTKAIQDSYTEQAKLITMRRTLASETNVSIANTYAEMYKKTGQYPDYKSALKTTLESEEKIGKEEESQRKFLQSMIDSGVYTNGYSYDDAAKEIADLEAKAASREARKQDLRNKIDQADSEKLARDVRVDTMPETANLSLLGTYTGMFQRSQKYTDADKALEGQYIDQSSLEEYYRNAAEKQLAIIQSHNKDNPYETEEAELADWQKYFDYQQKSAQFGASKIQSRYAREANVFTSVQKAQADQMRPINAATAQLQVGANMYLDNEDYDKYYETLNNVNLLLEQSISTSQDYIAQYEEMMKYVTDPELLDQLSDYIDKEKLSILNNTKAIQDNTKAREANHFTQLQTEYQDSMRGNQHAMTMNQSYADIYLGAEQFTYYRESLAKVNEGIRKDIRDRKTYLEQLKEEAKKVGDNIKLKRQYADAIEAAEQALANDTKRLQDNTKAIEENIRAQIDLINTRSTLASKTNADLAGQYAQEAKASNNYGEYRENLSIQNADTSKTISANNIAMGTYQYLLDTGFYRNEGERQAAVERLNQLKQENVGLSISNAQNERDIRQSYIDEITNNVQTETMGTNSVMDIMGGLASRYSSRGNFSGSRAAYQQQSAAASSMIKQYQKAYDELFVKRAEMEEGSPEWIAATEQLNAFKSKIIELQSVIQDAADAIQKSIIDEIIKKYSDALRAPQSNVEKAGIYAQGYSMTREFDLYRDMLEVQSGHRNIISEKLQEEIAEIEGQLGNLSGEAFDTAVQELYSKRNEYEQLYMDNLQAQIDIANSKADEALRNREKRVRDVDREISMNSAAMNYYQETKNTEAYQKAAEKQAEAIRKKQAIEKEEIQTLMAIAAQTPRNTEGFEKLEEQIYASADSIAGMDLELLKLNKDLKNMELDEIFERIGRVDETDTHQLSMLSTEMGRYENLGELSNVNIMINHENELQEKRAQHINEFLDTLNAQLGTVEAGSDEYWRLASAIMKYEEELANTNATIEANNKRLKENERAILQTRKTAEDAVVDEIKNRIQQQRDMLSATANIEEKIVDIIRKGYQDRWEIYRKDREEQKRNLENERNLLNERLNMRKNAIEQERNQNELTSLQQQLALISSDSSRTKEAKELQKRIADLQKDMAMSTAEAEVNAQSEQIEDQINAIDEDVSFRQEKLDAFLEDATNFRDVVDELMSGSFEDLAEWVKKNDETYRFSLDAGRQQMLQSWEDTWKEMRGIIDMYWEEVEAIMASTQSYVEYFKQSREWLAASDTGRALIEDEASQRYEDVINAERISQPAIDYAHNDAYIVDRTKNDEFNEWLYNVLTGVQGAPEIHVERQYEDNPDYGSKSNNDGLPYLGERNNEKFLDGLEKYIKGNEDALASFKSAVGGLTESPIYQDIIDVSGKLEGHIKELEDMRTRLSEMSEDDEGYEKLIGDFSNLQATVAEETSTRDEYTRLLGDDLTKYLKEAFSLATTGLNEMKAIATDEMNDLNIAIGKEGLEKYAESVEIMQGNKEELLNYIDGLDETTKKYLIDLYNNAQEGYTTQEGILTNMASSVDYSIEEAGLDFAETSTASAEEFKQTSEGLATNIFDVESAANQLESDMMNQAIADAKFVNDYYAGKNEANTEKISEDITDTSGVLKENSDKNAEENKEAAGDVKYSAEKILEAAGNVAQLSEKIDQMPGDINAQNASLISGLNVTNSEFQKALNATFDNAVGGMNNAMKSFDETVVREVKKFSAATDNYKTYTENLTNDLRTQNAGLVEGLNKTNNNFQIALNGTFDNVVTGMNNSMASFDGSVGNFSNAIAGLETWLSGKNADLESLEKKIRTQLESYSPTAMADTTGTPSGNTNLDSPSLPKQETLSAEDVVKNLYRSILGREADASGLAHWADILAKDGVAAVVSGLQGSQEYINKNYPGIVPNVPTGQASGESLPLPTQDTSSNQGSSTPKEDHGYSFSINGSSYSARGMASKQEAQKAFNKKWNDVLSDMYATMSSTAVEIMKRNATIRVYKEGGLIDFTGPAWVDGTPSKPEGILSNADLEHIRALTAALNYVAVPNPVVPSSEFFSDRSTNIGDINVTINQAELKSDADYEEVARKVGNAITKQMSRDGMSMRTFAF